MATRDLGSDPAIIEKTYEGLTPGRLVEIYRLMFLSRRIDDREIMLKRQQKIFFQISCAGHEALLVGAAWRFGPATTGSSPTIAIARSAWPWALRLRDAAAGGGRGRRSGQRRTPDAFALGQPRAPYRHTSALRPRRSACTPSAVPRQDATSAAILKRQPRPPATIAISRRAVSRRTRSSTSPSARERHRRASSGSRSTRPRCGGCRCCTDRG